MKLLESSLVQDNEIVSIGTDWGRGGDMSMKLVLSPDGSKYVKELFRVA